jgi:hypothetical protein
MRNLLGDAGEERVIVAILADEEVEWVALRNLEHLGWPGAGSL